MIPTLMTAAVLAVFAFAAWRDVTDLKIRNNTVFAALGVMAAWYLAHPQAFEWNVLWVALIFFAIGFGMWMLGLFGGGDAKFMPVVGLCAGTAHLAEALFVMAIGSVVLVMAFGTVRLLALSRVPLPGPAVRYISTRQLPLCVPLAAAAAAALLLRSGALV